MSEYRPRGIMFLAADIMAERTVVGESIPGSIPDIGSFLELGPTLAEHFDFVWLTDNLGYRSTWVLLAAMAREWEDLDIGVCTTWMYGRNPIEITEIGTSITELMPEREFTLGISRGNRIISSTFEPHRPVRVMRETIEFSRELQAGNHVRLAEYPALAEVCNFREDGTARLYFDAAEFPIVVGSTGPVTLRMAGEYADGAVFVSQQPNQSLAAWRQGVYEEVSGIAELREGRDHSCVEEFNLVNGISLSVSRDGDLAREFARREISNIVASKSDEVLRTLEIDTDRVDRIREVIQKGGGFGEPSEFVTTDMLEKLMFAGTPDDVVDDVAETARYAHEAGFDKQMFILPLGPDLKEAVELITEELLPRL